MSEVMNELDEISETLMRMVTLGFVAALLDEPVDMNDLDMDKVTRVTNPEGLARMGEVLGVMVDEAGRQGVWLTKLRSHVAETLTDLEREV